MVAGHLRIQNGIYQIILSYKDRKKTRKTKSISTGLPEKGNKKRAQALLDKVRKEFIPDIWDGDTLFCEFLTEWLEYADLKPDYYATCKHNINCIIAPYFKGLNVTISSIAQRNIEQFFCFLKSTHTIDEEKRKNITADCYFILKSSLNYALSRNLITTDIISNVDPFTGKSDILFADFLLSWLNIIQRSVDIVTYASYATNIKGKVVPYFRDKNYTLKDLEENPTYIQDYYQYELEENHLTTNTILHRHANIRKCLQYAFQTGLILSNPADRIERPQKNEYKAEYYTSQELEQLFEVFKGDPMEIPVILAAFYGMRRSEALGIKWDYIDFKNKTISIRHVVTDIYLDGHTIHVAKDKTKNKSSTRTLPLVAPFEQALLQLKEQQLENQTICGSSYNFNDQCYINVNKMGDLLKPGYLTQHFKIVLRKHGLREIRFHDLRHSCASLLYANGVDMKSIQEWLGHSTIATTANTYTHFDYNRKNESANAIIGNYPT